MSIESIHRETVLNSEIDLDLPEGSILTVEMELEVGTEFSVMRVVGGDLIAPVTVLCRLAPRTTKESTKITFVNSKTGDARLLTLPPNNGVNNIQLSPVIAQTSNKVILERVANSSVKNLLDTAE